MVVRQHGLHQWMAVLRLRCGAVPRQSRSGLQVQRWVSWQTQLRKGEYGHRRQRLTQGRRRRGLPQRHLLLKTLPHRGRRQLPVQRKQPQRGAQTVQHRQLQRGLHLGAVQPRRRPRGA